MTHHHHHVAAPACSSRFERIRYFYGQLLGVREFRAEQDYFRDKHKLHNRYLHGYGVVCGLEVRACAPPRGPCDPPPTTPPAPKGPPAAPTRAEAAAPTAQRPHPTTKPPPSELPTALCLELECGLALDCQGNELLVPSPCQLDLLAVLDCDERAAFLDGAAAWISLCYVERPSEPVRPVTTDTCGTTLPDCVPSRLRDDYCLRVTLHEPAHDEGCGPCDRACCDPCLPLARARLVDGNLEIDNGVRRLIGPYETTRITGVSWSQGATYTTTDVDRMLKAGLVLQFSGPVRSDSLRRGVIDVWVIQGGGGRNGDIYSVATEVTPGDVVVDKLPGEFTTTATVRIPVKRHGGADRIDPGDRILVTVRSPFILDRCCRPIDGDHVAGMTPVIPAYASLFTPREQFAPPRCVPPDPRSYRRPRSGEGVPGGNFEGWFYVAIEGEE